MSTDAAVPPGAELATLCEAALREGLSRQIVGPQVVDFKRSGYWLAKYLAAHGVTLAGPAGPGAPAVTRSDAGELSGAVRDALPQTGDASAASGIQLIGAQGAVPAGPLAQAIHDALEEALDAHWGKAYLLRDHDERNTAAMLEDAWASTVAGLSGRHYAALARRGLEIVSRVSVPGADAPEWTVGAQLAALREAVDCAMNQRIGNEFAPESIARLRHMLTVLKDGDIERAARVSGGAP